MTDRVPRLHVLISPATALPGWEDAAVTLTEIVVAAGAPAIQSRVKHPDVDVRLAADGRIVAAAQATGAVAIVNDRAEVAVAVGADGVHGGATDLSPAAMRAIVGPDRLVGATARHAESARRARDEGADYLGVGPFRLSGSKSGLPDPIGIAGIAAVAEAVGLPVLAIGGVTAADVSSLVAAGAHGVAVIGTVAGAADPAGAVRELVDALLEAIS